MQKKFLRFIDGDKSILERNPLERIAKLKQLAAFKHEGFWQCMDTKKDKDTLTKILKKNLLNKKKSILIVGGTGFIGYHLAKTALKKNFQITSLSSKKPKKFRKLPKVKYILCDISKKKILEKN